MSATATGLDSKAEKPETDSVKTAESGRPVADAPAADAGGERGCCAHCY